MNQQISPAEHGRINRTLKYIGLCMLVLAVAGALLDLLDWRMRKTTSSVSSYAFSGNTIVFSGMTNGNVNVTVGEPGKVTIVYRLTEGIRKLHVGEQTRGSTFAIQESGDCNNKLSLRLLGNCSSQYQVEVPANTTIVANSKDASISVIGVNGNHRLETDNGAITVKDVATQSIAATTNGGSVLLQLLGAPSNIAAHSSNGDVSIQLQNTTTAYRTIVTSRSGRVKVNVKTNQQSSQHVIAASSSRGGVLVTY
jgi:hypothetical protein